MCILISVLFLGGYLPSMFAIQDFYFINTFIEDWSLKVEELLYYNKLYLDNIISLITQTKYSTICYLDFMILTIFTYIYI
jgi:hypothetical protein